MVVSVKKSAAAGKSKKADVRAAVRAERTVRKAQSDTLRQVTGGQLRYMAGAERFKERDPVYHISETFCTRFENFGRAESEKFYNSALDGGQSVQRGRDDAVSGADGNGGNVTDSLFFKNFSDTAFRSGKLFGSVRNGSGKMMLTSCLNRAACPSESVRQRKLFKGSTARDIDGSFGDKVVLNKGVADSAVGIAVSALKDSRRVVESFIKVAGGIKIAGGKNSDGSGSETMHKMFPFLTLKYDRECLEKYNAGLKNNDSPEQRDILKRAAAKTTAVIEKKELMRVRLIDSLRALSENAGSVIGELGELKEELEQSRSNKEKETEESETAEAAENIEDVEDVELPPNGTADDFDGFAEPLVMFADSLDFAADNSTDGYEVNTVDTSECGNGTAQLF